MESTIDLASCLADIPDRRRAEGKMYGQVGVILFSIIAMLSGARSYRQIHTLIDRRLAILNAAFPQAALRCERRSRSALFQRRLDSRAGFGLRWRIVQVVHQEGPAPGAERVSRAARRRGAGGALWTHLVNPQGGSRDCRRVISDDDGRVVARRRILPIEDF